MYKMAKNKFSYGNQRIHTAFRFKGSTALLWLRVLLCPFHADQIASLQVHLEKNFYKCHACGKTGYVI